MKKTIVFTLLSLLFIAFCFILFLYLGQYTQKQYYQDGTLKSVSQRSFFKENGEYNLYNKDGSLSQQYTFKNGIKDGPAKIYINSQTLIDINYNNGTASIDLVSNFPDIKKFFDEFIFTLSTDNSFKINLKKIKFKSDITGKLLCKTDVFAEKIQKYFQNKTTENLKDLLNCLNIQSLNVGDHEFTCSYNGEYIYPEFKSDAVFTCNGSFFDKESFKFLENVYFDATFDTQKKYLTIKTTNISDPQTYSSVSFKGLEEFLETLTEISFLHDKKLFKAKSIANILKNITISDSEVVVGEKRTFSTSGDFNFTTGFSDDYKILFYTENEQSSTIRIYNNKISLEVQNPITKKYITMSDIELGNRILSEYSHLSNFLIVEFLKNSDEIVKNLDTFFASLADTHLNISDIISRVNFNMFNKNKEKCLEFTLYPKKDIDLRTFFENIYKYIDIKIFILDNYTRPVRQHLITGNFVDGFTYETFDIRKSVSIKEIVDIIKNSNLEQNIKEIYIDLEQLYSPIEDDIISGKYPYFDPILFAIYQETKNFLNKYAMNKNIDQIISIVTNVRKSFENKESFDGLNNEYAKNQNIIPSDMYNENAANIKNASGGDVVIKASKLNNNDALSNKSFVIEFTGLSQEECMVLAANNWTIPDLVAIAAGKENINPSSEGYFGTVGFAVDEALKDNVLSAKIQKDFILAMPENRFVPTPITYIQAYTACSGNKKDNAVALKFK